MRLELHPEARAELRSAALWYDERRSGLGDEFVAAVSAALDRIGDAPGSYPAWPGTRETLQWIPNQKGVTRWQRVISCEDSHARSPIQGRWPPTNAT